MKLVFVYDDSDGYTYNTTHHIPFEYESVEKAEYDFLELWEHNDMFEFANTEFGKSQFFNKVCEWYNQGPKIYTLDDWFEEFK